MRSDLPESSQKRASKSQKVGLLRERLDALRAASTHRRALDPVDFPHRYRAAQDVELVALLSSSLAYGRAEFFRSRIDALLSRFGPNPAEAVARFRAREARALLGDFVYRFNNGADLATLLYGAGALLARHGSLETIFLRAAADAHPRTAFAKALIDAAPAKDIRAALGAPRALAFLLPTHPRGAAKRLNLFLRWMVRGPDGIDFGLWRGVSPSTLVIPLDVHVARVARALGFTKRRADDFQTAVEVTESLRRLDPEDPVKYDFALCHLGMSGACPSNRRAAHCAACSLREVCPTGMHSAKF